MNAYLAFIRNNLRLMLRERSVLFFNYVFPLIFFFIFANSFKAGQGGAINYVFASILVIGVIGNGLFGGGIRPVIEREMNILRRFKVAPITPLPILVASVVSGIAAYLPSVLLTFALSYSMYGMKVPQRWLSLLVFILFAVIAFRAIGMIIASVVNSMAESQIITQLLYFPMLFLSGATFTIEALPSYLQIVAQFIPATYLHNGVQGMLLRNENLWTNRLPLAAMMLTTVLALLVSSKLFRWEKEEKLKPSAKFWVLGVLAPFFVMGAWQAYSKDNVEKSKILLREIRRSRTWLIKDARVFTGDGMVFESAHILVRGGRIERIYTGSAPDAKTLKAEPIEAMGKTVLPGLIDVHVHLGSPGGFSERMQDAYAPGREKRALAAYLYCGTVAVKSTGDWIDTILETRTLINSGRKLGAELFTTGPLFTAEGGHPTQMLKYLPESMKQYGREQFVRLPKSRDEARRMVGELAARKVDGIKAVLDQGVAGQRFARMDLAILETVIDEARARKLSVIVHTGSAKDVADAVALQPTGIEHGSLIEAIPDSVFRDMARLGIFYDPTLSVAEGFTEFAAGRTELLDRTLLQQSAPPGLLAATKKFLASPLASGMRAGMRQYGVDLDIAMDNLRRAVAAGVPVVTGSDAGNPLVFHGPTVQRELQLWVKAGVSPSIALQAATRLAAQYIGAGSRLGRIAPGFEASLLLVDGNPLKDIAAVERVSLVLLKGETIPRGDLFEQED
ncbi:MAG: ABC transporter permease [Bryobacter sp.]|nr:ABC transporter permease [Bryobacter sp.]